MSENVYLRALQRAAQVLGSTEALRRHLQVPMTTLHLWLRGEATPPDGVFLQVVDLLAEQDLFEIKNVLRNRHAG